MADLSRSAVARYIQLATLFRHRIEQGTWAKGSQIPTVEDLAAEFGVARATMRQALGILESEGLIARYRAKGTFVTRRPQEQLWCEVETDFSGLLTARPGASIEIMSEEIVDQPTLVPHLIGDLAPRYLHLQRRHEREGVRFLIADIYVELNVAQSLPPEAFKTRTALRLAASAPGVQIADARQTLTIGAADIETADHLQLPLNAPVAHVSRSAVDQSGQLVVISNGTYRGDVVRVDIKLK
jgi:GntR family transcriptional regulator